MCYRVISEHQCIRLESHYIRWEMKELLGLGGVGGFWDEFQVLELWSGQHVLSTFVWIHDIF